MSAVRQTLIMIQVKTIGLHCLNKSQNEDETELNRLTWLHRIFIILVVNFCLTKLTYLNKTSINLIFEFTFIVFFQFVYIVLGRFNIAFGRIITENGWRKEMGTMLTSLPCVPETLYCLQLHYLTRSVSPRWQCRGVLSILVVKDRDIQWHRLHTNLCRLSIYSLTHHITLSLFWERRKARKAFI